MVDDDHRWERPPPPKFGPTRPRHWKGSQMCLPVLHGLRQTICRLANAHAHYVMWSRDTGLVMPTAKRFVVKVCSLFFLVGGKVLRVVGGGMCNTFGKHIWLPFQCLGRVGPNLGGGGRSRRWSSSRSGYLYFGVVFCVFGFCFLVFL